MPAIRVKAKINGYHPSSGLFLEEGEYYDIDETAFSDQVFELEPEP
jgi:hypothetical protein